jgi:hypothetical protein
MVPFLLSFLFYVRNMSRSHQYYKLILRTGYIAENTEYQFRNAEALT